jgi:hypothetical protein
MSSLSRTALNEYYVQIGNALPPPINPTPELRQRRLTTAVETFHALRPANANEALLAVKIVLCSAHAIDALREAGVYRDDFPKMSRCRAQAASMMRGEQSARRTLAQEQKMRLAVEAVAGSVPVQPAIPLPHDELQPVPRPVQATQPRRHTATKPAPQPAGGESAPSPTAEALAKAEAYAAENGVAAAQIRHDRGVTPQNTAYFHHLTLPTDPELIDALVRGTSDLLAWLDEIGGEDLENAA